MTLDLKRDQAHRSRLALDGREMERRVKVIYNPAADRGKAAALLPDLRRCLSLPGAVHLAQTSRPGEATVLAAQALAQGYEVIAAAGGDGTVNEVINGFMTANDERARGTLGVIPIGSGNDFAWGIGVARDLRGACERLFVGRRRQVDIGRIGDGGEHSRYFCNGVGIGFDAAVACEVRKMRRVGGFLMYLVGVMRTLVLHHKAPHTIIRIDGQEISGEFLMVTVSSGQRYGGGFRITPEAVMDDGSLDLCIVSKMARLAILRMIPRFIRGSHVGHGLVQMQRGQHIVVDICGQQPVHVDGEIFTEHAGWLKIEVLPRHLWVTV
jgi:diacylglycerol kinase (ATP)